MMMNGWHLYGWGGGVMLFAWILLIGIAVYLIIVAAGKKKDQGTMRETALDILKKRYASGELSGDEFEKMKRDIQ